MGATSAANRSLLARGGRFHRRTRLHLAKCAGVPHRRRIRLKQKRPRWGGRSCCRTSVRPTRRGSLPTAAARPPLANRRPIVVRPAPPMRGVVPLYEVATIPSTPSRDFDAATPSRGWREVGSSPWGNHDEGKHDACSGEPNDTMTESVNTWLMLPCPSPPSAAITTC